MWGNLTVRVVGRDNTCVARFGAYELVRQLGSGGMGEVWLAHRALGDGLEKTVALKFLPRHRDDDARARLDFQREVRLSMHLSHSAIVQVFDVSEHDGRACMVMEWVDGVDLARLLAHLRRRGERFPVSTSLHVIIQVLRALDYAHNLHHEGQPLGMVHRDVSPHNILISTSGDVKLTDFGIARVAREETSGAHVRGKLRYMAPEQFSGAPRSASFDLYAVGAVAHELLSGRRFRGYEGDGELYRAILEGVVPPLDREDVPEALKRLRGQLLDVDPSRRPASAQACLEVLAGLSMDPRAAEDLGQRCRALLGVDGPRSGEYEALSSPTVQPLAPSGPASGPTSGPAFEGAFEGGQFDRRTATMPSVPARDRAAGTRFGRGRAGLALGASLLAVVVSLALAFVGRETGPSARRSAEGSPMGDENAAGGLAAALTSNSERASKSLPSQTLADGARHEVGQRDGETSRPEGQGARAELDSLRPAPSSAFEPKLSPGSSTESDAGGGAGAGTTATAGLATGAGPDEAAEKVDTPAETARPREATTPRVTVTLRASEYDFAYVRVRGRSYALEPSVNVRLPVGRHRIDMRESLDMPWRNLGAVTLRAGERYDARLRRPGRVDLQAR